MQDHSWISHCLRPPCSLAFVKPYNSRGSLDLPEEHTLSEVSSWSDAQALHQMYALDPDIQKYKVSYCVCNTRRMAESKPRSLL